ncbi:MAG: VOC family protein [Thermomicrobiales bacterium]
MSAAAVSSAPVRIDGLFETHLTVGDLDRSIAFYRDLLGLPLAYTQPERGVAFFWLGGPGKGMLGLWKAGTVLRMHLHLALTVSLDELLAAPAKLRAAGITPRGFGGEPSDEPMVHCWMPAAAVFFTDPDGHSLEYLAMLPAAPRPDLGVLNWAAWQARDAG